MKIINLTILLILQTLLFSRPVAEKETDNNYFLKIEDYRKREVIIRREPKRIISMAPNITEIIFDLGVQSKLVARTDYCDYPAEVINIPSIGNLLTPSIEKIVELNPDLIIGGTHFSNDLLNRLTDLSITVVIIDELGSLEGIYKNIRDIGLLTNRNNEAEGSIKKIKTNIDSLSKKVVNTEKPKVYYAISYGEYGDFTAGGDTFISELITMAGGENIAYDSSGWSYSLEKVLIKNPDIIICSKYNGSKEGLINASGYREIPAVKNNRVYEIDNNLIDRQGPRVYLGLKELIDIFHQGLP